MAAIKVPILEDMLCIYRGPSGTESICSGDSGGPLMIKSPLTINNVALNDDRLTLIGIASFSVSDCSAPFPAVFARMTYFLDWVLAVMHEY